MNLLTNMSNDQVHIWLDAADKLIKAIAVTIGGVWTWYNYRKTRPHSLKLDLAIEGKAFFKSEWFLSATVSVRNIGATRLSLQSEGTVCELFAVFDDMSEKQLDAVELTIPERYLASGEVMQDHFQWKVPSQTLDVIWYRIEVRVIADKLEWGTKCLIRAVRG